MMFTVCSDSSVPWGMTRMIWWNSACSWSGLEGPLTWCWVRSACLPYQNPCVGFVDSLHGLSYRALGCLTGQLRLQVQVPQETGSGSCQFPKVWAQKLTWPHFYWWVTKSRFKVIYTTPLNERHIKTLWTTVVHLCPHLRHVVGIYFRLLSISINFVSLMSIKFLIAHNFPLSCSSCPLHYPQHYSTSSWSAQFTTWHQILKFLP